MPERPRLEVTPDFIPYVLAITNHGRVGEWKPPASRPFALDGPTEREYAEHRVQAHEACINHQPVHVNRFGMGTCRCGAAMWSPWWVADGLYGLASALSGTRARIVRLPEHEDDPIEEINDAFDGTANWIAEHEETWKSRVSTVERDE